MMPCHPLPGGGFACSHGRRRVERCACGAPATQLCDWPTRGRKRGPRTCDAPLCARCATSPGPEIDLCAEHAHLWRARGSMPADLGKPIQGDLFRGGR